MQNMEQTVHNFTDLESCYDRQLANLCRVVEEAVGIERIAIKLFIKVIPWFEHCTHTHFGISEESYGDRNDPLGGLGQGMALSGSANRDMSCFMFKALEEKGHGFKNIDSIKLEQMIKKVSVFVDDTDLWENGQWCGEMMNAILKEHAALHESIGGKMQYSKSGLFSWKWVLNNRIKVP